MLLKIEDDPVLTAVLLRSTEVNPEPRTERAIKVLTEAGYQVTLLNWERTRQYSKERVSSTHHKSLHLKAPYGAGSKNIARQFIWQIWLFKNLISKRYNLVYACDADTGLIALFTQKLKNFILVYDQFDPISSRSSNKYLQLIGEFIETLVIKHVDFSIFATESRFKPSPKSYIVVSNNRVNALKPATRKERDKLKICYFGVLQPDRGLLELIEAVEQVKNVQLSIAGFGPLENQIAERVSRKVSFMGRLTQEEGMALLAESDVSCAMYDPKKSNNRNTASSKFFDSVVAGTPVITSANTEVGHCVIKFGMGWVIPYGDLETLKNLLSTIASKNDELIPGFEILRTTYLEQFNFFNEEKEFTLRIKMLGANQ